mmetsp:Transcript_9184/g.23140  ORF Transcript_9184/g.23140 Transcript_9184/m.23140 type:complete len:268 (+) Transcript_9184:554-1357(+)
MRTRDVNAVDADSAVGFAVTVGTDADATANRYIRGSSTRTGVGVAASTNIGDADSSTLRLGLVRAGIPFMRSIVVVLSIAEQASPPIALATATRRWDKRPTRGISPVVGHCIVVAIFVAIFVAVPIARTPIVIDTFSKFEAVVHVNGHVDVGLVEDDREGKAHAQKHFVPRGVLRIITTVPQQTCQHSTQHHGHRNVLGTILCAGEDLGGLHYVMQHVACMLVPLCWLVPARWTLCSDGPARPNSCIMQGVLIVWPLRLPGPTLPRI